MTPKAEIAALVEQAAKAMHAHHHAQFGRTWESEREESRQDYRDLAKAALSAANPVPVDAGRGFGEPVKDAIREAFQQGSWWQKNDYLGFEEAVAIAEKECSSIILAALQPAPTTEGEADHAR